MSGDQAGRSRTVVRDQGGDPGKRYSATLDGFTAASWSPEAALAEVRRMQSAARRAEAGVL